MQDEVSSCRLDGLKQLFNMVHYDGQKVYKDKELEINGIISKENFPTNKGNWKIYAESLVQRCRDFI